MQAGLYFDGSSFDKGRRGGPGPSSGAAVLIAADGSTQQDSVFIARSESTCAEFLGLICGLRLALENGVRDVSIYGDSRIVIDAILGLKLPKKIELNALREESLALLDEFDRWTLQWIPRRKNFLADQAARRCLVARPSL